MCNRIISYDCGHVQEVKTECKEFTQRKKRANKTRGFWKSLFSQSTETKCTVPPSRTHYVYAKCPKCVAKDESIRRDEERRIARQKETDRREYQQIEARRKEWDRQQVARYHQDTKRKWTCERCKAERRKIENWHRDVNGGACCARGVDEFEEWGKKQGYCPSKPHLPFQTRRPQTDPPRALTREEKQPSLKHCTSIELAKAEAKVAAQNYGWKNERSSTISSELVGGFVALSGTDPRALPPPPPEPHLVYKEPDIDWDRWGQNVRTSHGVYPPASPSPDDPLPVRPLKIRSSSAQAYVASPAEPRQSFTIPRKPVPATAWPAEVGRPKRSRKMSSSRGPPQSTVDIYGPGLRHERRRINAFQGPLQSTVDENGISPPSSPVHSSYSSISPISSGSSSKSSNRNHLRSSQTIISEMNHFIEDQMDTWGTSHTEESVPALPPFV